MSLPRTLSPPAAQGLGWAAVALADAVALTIRLPARVRLAERAVIHFYDAAHILSLGLVTAALVAAHRRFGPRSRLASYGLLTALAWAIGLVALDEDLAGLSEQLPVFIPAVWQAALSLVVALSIPAAAWIGRVLARRWLRLLALAAGLGAAIAHGLSYPSAYAGLHLFAAAACAIGIGAALEGAALPARLGAPPPAGRFAGAVRTALSAVASLAAAFSLVVLPGTLALSHMLRQPSAVLVPFLAPLHADDEVADLRVPLDQRAWFEDRSDFPPIPPSSPPLLGPDALVFLLSIDSMRADILADDKHRATLPELFRLRDQSTYFPDTRSPGASTGVTLAATFSGLYYSQQYWVRGRRADGLVYPDQDPSPRFPELLAKAGVTTVTFDATGWLLNEYGVVRGFTEQKTLRTGKPYIGSRQLMDATLERLSGYSGGRMFVFLHFMDAHSPYTSAGKKSSPFAGYVAELALVDAQIARLREALEQRGLLDRSCIVVMADHGEAFGEHGLTWHANSLYDELLRVPLFIRLPGAAPRRVEDRVSLMDVGPTILDLFGVDTPPRWMGESLTGYLRGETPELTRPILAEARLKRAMVMPDGVKIIHDTRNHSVEVYDLTTDPGEQENLYQQKGSASGAASADRLQVLSSFFRVHTHRRPGYNVPYRKW